MSLINRMLRELDARAAVPDAPLFAQHLRPLRREVPPATAGSPRPGRRDMPIVWRVSTALLLVVAGTGAWLAYALVPASLPVEALAAVAPSPRAERTATPSAAAPAPQPLLPESSSERDRELLPPRAADAVDDAFGPAMTAPPVSRTRKPAQGLAAIDPRPVPPAPAGKQVADTPQARAAAEFKRGLAHAAAGRGREAVLAMRAALAADPAAVAARQALIAVLVEQGRRQEAEAAAREGLGADPQNAFFAMVTARLAHDRGDAGEALGVLERHAAAGAGNGEYRALAGGLYYQARRYTDALREYAAAVELAPQDGTSWTGLAMSLEACGRRDEALAAYQRARTSGSLGAGLAGYVEQRLRALR